MLTHPRRPWLAALLSLLTSPGLGQLYNGRVFKAASFLLGLPLATFPAFWVAMEWRAAPVNVLLPLAGLLALQILSAIDAVRDARKLRTVPRPWYGRWYACVAVWALNVFVILPAWVTLLRTSWVQAFRIPGGAMHETILVGDCLLADKAAYGYRLPGSNSTLWGQREPERGDLIVFIFPLDRKSVFLKRVVGLPGETIEIRSKSVYVNRQPLEEPYAGFLDSHEQEMGDNWGPEKVPAGELFVLGDNRDNSRDSRYWGFVPVRDVLGMAKVIYFSWDSREQRPRWERIGQPLR